jgi:hypothetical protein
MWMLSRGMGLGRLVRGAGTAGRLVCGVNQGSLGGFGSVTVVVVIVRLPNWNQCVGMRGSGSAKSRKKTTTVAHPAYVPFLCRLSQQLSFSRFTVHEVFLMES